MIPMVGTPRRDQEVAAFLAGRPSLSLVVSTVAWKLLIELLDFLALFKCVASNGLVCKRIHIIKIGC